MLILAELIVCSKRGFTCILAKWFWHTVMSLSFTYGSPEASCNKRVDTYFGRRSAGLMKEFWTLCIFVMTVSETVMVETIPTGTQPPRFYSLPKIHKYGTPMRPVVSYKGTPLYEISKHIASILKLYGKLKEQHTHSSKSFSAFICQQKIEPDEIMVSCDVTSLYTTIPIDQALLIIKHLPEHDDKLADRTLLSPRKILDLLDILLRTTYFKFNGDFYRQTDGAAMGGPTSAIVSEIYVQSLETTAVTQQTTLPKSGHAMSMMSSR